MRLAHRRVDVAELLASFVTVSETHALGATIPYVIGLFWHQMVAPTDLLMLVCAGVSLGVLSASLKPSSLRK